MSLKFTGEKSPKEAVKVMAVGDGRTKQSERDGTDINKIVARYRKTGILPATRRVQPVFADVTGISDFHTMLNRVEAGKAAFQSLPAVVRKKFGNDVESMVAWLQDSKNMDEAIEMGLVEKPQGYVSPKDKAPAAPASGPAEPAK